MNVIIIRHGQTECNTQDMHQGPNDALTLTGEMQARCVARKLQSFPIDIILSSTFPRAKRTTEIVNELLQKDVEYSDMLREVLKPSELHGRAFHDPASERVRSIIRSHSQDPNWHFSDEENYHDYTTRARECLDWITAKSQQNILVVTHGTFLRVILGVMLFGDRLTPEHLRVLRKFFCTAHTGITLVERASNKTWVLKTWNDCAHLEVVEEAMSGEPVLAR